MTLATLSPDDTRAAIDAGARLIDIRGADEHARERIPGAMNVPLDRIGDLPRDDRPVVFHCKSGMRTAANAAQLGAAAGGAPAYIWAAASMRGGRQDSPPSPIGRSRWKSCGRCRLPPVGWC
ncbi:hypothetical protein SPKIRA_37810 (plasmid) [Sphingomonas paucimobilis]|nr:hypothetical protein SPKIRA_37810 [Sphingomonas paucimobilis]